MEGFVGNKVLKVGSVFLHKVEAVFADFGVHPLITVDLEGDGTEEAVAVSFHFDHFEGWFVGAEDLDELIEDGVFVDYGSFATTVAGGGGGWEE